MALVQKIECSECHRPTKAEEGLHIEGTIRHGYGGEVFGEEDEYFFCCAECLWNFLGLGDLPVENSAPVAVEAPRSGQRIEVGDTPQPFPVEDETFSIPPPPPGLGPVPDSTGAEAVPRKVPVIRKSPPKKLKKSESAPVQAKPRKLFQDEEPVGYFLPKGLPNTGKLPGELKKYAEGPGGEGIREMEKGIEARLRASLPEPPEG